VRCNVLQHVSVCLVESCYVSTGSLCSLPVQSVAVYCSPLLSVAVCCSLLWCVAAYRLTHDAWQVRDRLSAAANQSSPLVLLLQSENEELETVLARNLRVADAGEDLQCVAVCCGVLQCVAVCCSV